MDKEKKVGGNLERCFPVEISRAIRRKQNVKDTYFDVKEKLGL